MSRRRPPSVFDRIRDAWGGIRDVVEAATDPHYYFNRYRPHRRTTS